MPSVPPNGSPYDFYTSAGERDIGIFPGQLIPEVPDSIPVCLQRGDRSWGGIHIATKHGHWLDGQKLDVHEMVWLKLRQPGSIYSTESDGKLKISLRIHPSALLILRLIRGASGKSALGDFMTVVSVYFHPKSLDGKRIAAYQPIAPPQPFGKMPIIPQYALPLPPPLPLSPTVIYRKKRVIVPPAADGSDSGAS
jgi:hypothetical protein